MKTILHCDANNFYASVECYLNPALRDKFVAVSGNPEKRHGIILAKNQAAKKMGVKTGETIWQARQKCPDLICVPPHFDTYVEFSNRIFDIYSQYTDRVQPFGIDECWLDVTGSRRLFGDGRTIADALRERIKKEIGVTISVGVSFTKVFAKLGSDMKKPDATTVITPENYRELVWKLDCSDLLMIGRKTAEKLRRIGIYTIGDLANTDVEVLRRLLGINGVKLYESANGMVATRMRKYGFYGEGIGVGLRFNDLTHTGKQSAMPPTDNAMHISDCAMNLIDKLYAYGKDLPVRAVSVGVFDLSTDAHERQLSIFDEEEREGHSLGTALDKIRRKYGYGSILSAAVLQNAVICDGLEDSDFLPFKK